MAKEFWRKVTSHSWWVHSEAALSQSPTVPSGQVCSPMLLSAAYSLMHFNRGNDWQNYFFPWGIWAPPNTWFPGSTRVHNQNSMSIGLSIFVGLTIVTNRHTDGQTDHPTTIARDHICALCIWSKNTDSMLTGSYQYTLKLLQSRHRQCNGCCSS